MPYSTNAPRNDQGWAQVLRDIEVLYLKLQELNNGNYINNEDGSQGSGDLNPGGGSQVSQQIPDDAWGRSRSRNASPVIHSGTWEATRGGIAASRDASRYVCPGAATGVADWGCFTRLR